MITTVLRISLTLLPHGQAESLTTTPDSEVATFLGNYFRGAVREVEEEWYAVVEKISRPRRERMELRKFSDNSDVFANATNFNEERRIGTIVPNCQINKTRVLIESASYK